MCQIIQSNARSRAMSSIRPMIQGALNAQARLQWIPLVDDSQNQPNKLSVLKRQGLPPTLIPPLSVRFPARHSRTAHVRFLQCSWHLRIHLIPLHLPPSSTSLHSLERPANWNESIQQSGETVSRTKSVQLID